MARMELTDGSERPVLKLVLGVGFLLLAVGYAQIEYPLLFVVGYAAVGVVFVLEYAAPRFRRRMDEFRSKVSRIAAITGVTAFAAVLFWRYGHPRWARPFTIGAVVLSIVLVVRNVRNR